MTANADHVVYDTRAQEFRCQHCRATYKPALPAPLATFVAMSKSFVKIHRDCKPGVAD